MQIQSILTPGRTYYKVAAKSKKKVLEIIADYISQDIPSLNSAEIFNALNARERLGSTGLGNGIAIPHCRMKNCSGIVGALVQLENPIDFEAVDDRPVDLLFVLLVPEQATGQHLETLAMLAERFGQPEYCKALRSADSVETLYQSAVS